MTGPEVEYRCGACKTEVQEQDKVCPKCGTDLSEVVQANDGAPDALRRVTTIAKLNSGASWFFWIAGLSIINSFITHFNGNMNFIAGLGITQVIDAIASSAENGVKIFGFVLDLLIAGAFVAFGIAGKRRYAWAFIVGMIIYGLDGLVFLAGPDFLAMGFHVFALIGIYKGYRAVGELDGIEKQQGVGELQSVERAIVQNS